MKLRYEVRGFGGLKLGPFMRLVIARRGAREAAAKLGVRFRVKDLKTGRWCGTYKPQKVEDAAS